MVRSFKERITLRRDDLVEVIGAPCQICYGNLTVCICYQICRAFYRDDLICLVSACCNTRNHIPDADYLPQIEGCACKRFAVLACLGQVDTALEAVIFYISYRCLVSCQCVGIVRILGCFSYFRTVVVCNSCFRDIEYIRAVGCDVAERLRTLSILDECILAKRHADHGCNTV